MKKQVFTVLILMVLAVTLLYAQNKLVMGVYLYDMGQKDYDELGIKENYGVMIDVLVKDGPADMAGLKPEDVILKIDGEKVRTTDQVSKMYYNKKKGQKIDVEVLRDGVKKTFSVALKEKEVNEKPYMGVYLADLSKVSYEKFEVSEMRGTLIKKVVNESPADEAGLMSKDVLITFGGEKIYSDNQLSRILKTYKIGDKVKLEVIREGKLEKLKITLGDRDDEKKEIKIKS
jgi:serine protease Do